MSLPRYPEYKDSGVAWLGEVPGHWEVSKLSAVALQSNAGEVIDKSYWSESGEVLYTCAREALFSDYLGFPDQKRTKPNDILLTRNGTPYVHLPVEGAIYTNVVQRVTLYEKVNRYFVRYTLGEATNHLVGYGVSIESLNYELWKGLRFPLPPPIEQQTIAAFLDRETGKIDALIAEQRRLVELLAEKRQAVISHAVTKGMNPNATMKDSGIAWLGEVPEHWEVCAIKRMTRLITDGAHISPETDGGIYDFISTKDISDQGIDFEGCLKTSPSSYEYLVRTGCEPLQGDVLFSKDGTIGRTTVVREQRRFVVASSLIIIRPDSAVLDSTFLHYLCQSFVVTQQVEGFVKGAGLPRLSIQNLLKVFGVFPQLAEQQAIATFLDSETAKFDTLTLEANRAIALLQERRSALISAAVTGKIDVHPQSSSQVDVNHV